MARIARVVAPGFPHLVTQRGNRGQTAFFGEGDYQLYIELMAQSCGKCGVEIWAYCLMPNHVYLIARNSPRRRAGRWRDRAPLISTRGERRPLKISCVSPELPSAGGAGPAGGPENVTFVTQLMQQDWASAEWGEVGEPNPARRLGHC